MLNYTFFKSIADIPLIITMLFSGILINRLGAIRSLKYLTVVMSVAQLVFAFSSVIGGGWDSRGTIFWLSAGRLIQLLSSHSAIIAQSVIIDKLFAGHSVAFALGMRTMLMRMTSVAAGWIIPQIFEAAGENLFVPFLFTALVCVSGALTA